MVPAAVNLMLLVPCLLTSHLLQRHVQLHQRGYTRLYTSATEPQASSQQLESSTDLSA